MRGKQHPVLAVTSKPGDKELLLAIHSTLPEETWECPCCEQVLPFQNLDWLDEIEILLARYSERIGINPSPVGFSLVEAWGHYKTLKRIKVDQPMSNTHDKE